MPRYVAFLRGVSPLNARMPDLKRCFEAAGFEDVRTLLSSGNVVFSSKALAEAPLAKRAEDAMQSLMGRSFVTIVRRTSYLQNLLDADPFAEFKLVPQAKQVIAFLRSSVAAPVELPAERHDAQILKVVGREVLCAYIPGPQSSMFMALLERSFGKNITTRTVATVRKCAWG
jgi:uncharacterized protein (DUF1697 family)